MSLKIIVSAAAVLAALSLVVAFSLPRLRESAGEFSTRPDQSGPALAPDGNSRSHISKPNTPQTIDDLLKKLEGSDLSNPLDDSPLLTKTRDWVARNRPADRPFNELEARILALILAAQDSPPNSLTALLDQALIEIEVLRAIDINADGTLSEDELDLFLADENAVPDPATHPLLSESSDASASLQAAIDRARLDTWDTDNDGVLSETETQIGRSAERNEQIQRLVTTQLDTMERDGMFEDQLTRDQAEQDLLAAYQVNRQVLNETQAGTITAENLLQSAQFEDLSDQAVQSQLTANMPEPPDFESFDANHDGEVDSAESHAFTLATAEFERNLRILEAHSRSDFLRTRFFLAVTRGDRDHDGRLSDAEWQLLIEQLVRLRNQRLFRLAYDLNHDRRVDDSELAQLFEWHNAGSLRADVNFDGLVDARDLEAARELFNDQPDN